MISSSAQCCPALSKHNEALHRVCLSVTQPRCICHLIGVTVTAVSHPGVWQPSSTVCHSTGLKQHRGRLWEISMHAHLGSYQNTEPVPLIPTGPCHGDISLTKALYLRVKQQLPAVLNAEFLLFSSTRKKIPIPLLAQLIPPHYEPWKVLASQIFQDCF